MSWADQAACQRDTLADLGPTAEATRDITVTTSAIDKIIVQDLAWVVSALLQLLELRRGVPAEGRLAALPAMINTGSTAPLPATPPASAFTTALPRPPLPPPAPTRSRPSGSSCDRPRRALRRPHHGRPGPVGIPA